MLVDEWNNVQLFALINLSVLLADPVWFHHSNDGNDPDLSYWSSSGTSEQLAVCAVLSAG